jgi:hypothetical protein
MTRWASSASHLYNRPVTSSETWTWLNSPAFRATPLDMKAEADRHFLEGINQLIGHGWPYSPPGAGEPGWSFYAAAVFNEHNPWWIVMPDIAAYLRRVSFLLRQGRPANDVAIYLPTDDAWASFTLGNVSLSQTLSRLLGSTLIPEILDAGYNFDFIDDDAIARAGVPHPVLILPNVERIPSSTSRKIDEYARRGGVVLALRRKPALAPGLLVMDESQLAGRRRGAASGQGQQLSQVAAIERQVHDLALIHDLRDSAVFGLHHGSVLGDFNGFSHRADRHGHLDARGVAHFESDTGLPVVLEAWRFHIEHMRSRRKIADLVWPCASVTPPCTACVSAWISVTGTPAMNFPEESETTPFTSATATAWACSPAAGNSRQTRVDIRRRSVRFRNPPQISLIRSSLQNFQEYAWFEHYLFPIPESTIDF